MKRFNAQEALDYGLSDRIIRPPPVEVDTPRDASAGLGSSEENEASQSQASSLTSIGILKKLKRYGISGILSYGLLNTVYYITTFLLAWFYIAPTPGKMGYFAAVERFLKLMAMVWAGSQVTKLLRAGA